MNNRNTLPAQSRTGQSNKRSSHLLRSGIVAVALTLAATSAAMGAVRVGPVDPSNGYPLFYEDANGLQLELCTDLVNCFFEVPNPGLPASFPDNWPDEAFYWAAESIMGDATTGANAILVMAREAAFFNDAVVDGDQIVFSRTRFYIDGAPQMVGNTYTITYPYGTATFESVSGDAGPGVVGEGWSSTRDVGITEALEFTAALNEFPVFLKPAAARNSALFFEPIPVTGSLLNTNFFRIEGAEIGTVYPSYRCADPTLGGVKDANNVDVLTDCVELDLFSIMGREALRFGVDIDKAVYEKVGTTTHVNVFAHSVEGQQLDASVDGVVVGMTEGSGGHYFARLPEPTTGGPWDVTKVTVLNLSDVPPSDKVATITDQVSITVAQWNADDGRLDITAQSSNEVDTAVMNNDVVAVVMSAQTGGTSSGWACTIIPPQRVAVVSEDGGYAVRDVDVIVDTTTQLSCPDGRPAVPEPLVANAGVDRTLVAGNTAIFNGELSTGAIASYSWTSTGLLPIVCLDGPCSQISVTTTTADVLVDPLVVDITLTVTDNAVPSNTASDTVQLTVIKPEVVVADACTIVTAEYRSRKDQWRVEGTTTLPANEDIYIFEGLPGALASIGSTSVEAGGVWAFKARGNGENTLPSNTEADVWVRFGLGSSDLNLSALCEAGFHFVTSK